MYFSKVKREKKNVFLVVWLYFMPNHSNMKTDHICLFFFRCSKYIPFFSSKFCLCSLMRILYLPYPDQLKWMDVLHGVNKGSWCQGLEDMPLCGRMPSLDYVHNAKLWMWVCHSWEVAEGGLRPSPVLQSLNFCYWGNFRDWRRVFHPVTPVHFLPG